MDWFSWLSKTNLEPSLVYEYCLAFSRNELQLEDASYFNHEFLQSMGISIAKHRLEILKLAKKEHEAVPSTNKLSGVIRKCLKKCLNKLIFREEEVKEMMPFPPAEPNWHQGKWRRALVTRYNGSEELKGGKGVHRSRTIAMSGPLDGRLMHEKMVSSKMLKFSGPLDGKMNERMVCTNRSPMMMIPTKSPRFSGTLDSRVLVNGLKAQWSESPMGYLSPYKKTSADSDSDCDESSLWHALLENLKPT